MNDLDELTAQIRPILKKYGIQKAGLFGSSVRGEGTVQDIDLLVKVDRRIGLLEFIGIKQELEDTLGMKVDLVEYDALKSSLKEDILKEEVPLL